MASWSRRPRVCKSIVDLNDLPQTSRQPVKQLMQDYGWWRHANNVLLKGPSGAGKTHIVAALGHKLIEQQVLCKWYPAVGLVQELQKAKKELDLMAYMTRLDKYQVIIVDGIGYVKKTVSALSPHPVRPNGM